VPAFKADAFGFGPDDPPVFDLAKGRAARDAGMDKLEGRNKQFYQQYDQYFGTLPVGWTGQSEDIRMVWSGISPTHHNVWGIAWKKLKVRGRITELPFKKPMTAEKSHGRRTNLHKKVF
jgi:hypothetical protein